MQTKANNPVYLLQDRNALPLIQVYFEFCQLKQLYRQGWLRRGVPAERCESVAEHILGMAVLSMLLADMVHPDIDRYKIMRLVLLHDFGEIYAGDIVPADHVSADDKHQRERESVLRVLGKLPNGQDYIALWQEYEDGASPESRFVHQIDRLEMGLQASVYEQQGLIDASEFLNSAAEALSAPELQTVLTALRALRD